jgi:hypothetical protein
MLPGPVVLPPVVVGVALVSGCRLAYGYLRQIRWRRRLGWRQTQTQMVQVVAAAARLAVQSREMLSTRKRLRNSIRSLRVGKGGEESAARRTCDGWIELAIHSGLLCCSPTLVLSLDPLVLKIVSSATKGIVQALIRFIEL